MVAIEIETIGIEKMVRGLNRISEDVKDFTVPFTFIIEDFEALEKKIFESEGYPADFKPLSPGYARWKKKHYSNMKIMQLTRRLYKSLTDPSNNKDIIRIIDKKRASRLSKVPYAHRHQMGTGKMPRREYVQVTETAKRRWVKIVQRWAMGLFEKYGITSYNQYKSNTNWR